MNTVNTAADAIDFSRIKQRKVIALLQKNGLYSLQDLSALRSLAYDPSDGKTYHKHLKSFNIQGSIDTVWNTYKTISPEETRVGNMVSFGLMYSRQRNAILYPGDVYTGMEAGQLIFLNLNLLGLTQLAVGHEIVEVNDADKNFKICYLQNGASTGTQVIQLKQISGSQTEVTHETWYRSDSFIRDRVLYPPFHEKGLTEFHESVKRKVELLP